MKKALFVSAFLALAVSLATAGGAAESSANYAGYLAQRGTIAPPDEISVSEFIGKVDYSYPRAGGAFGVSAYTGHRQVSADGQEEIIVIGLQGNDLAFEELPPLNLVFVIDKSGSMSGDKMAWVKESFDVFLGRVRDKDFVSVVAFDSTASVVFPSTQMREKREEFRRAVKRIEAGGGTDLSAGAVLGYEQALVNFRKEYTNRVLFLTDGQGNSHGLFDMAETYRGMGIGISTIGLGYGYDSSLLKEVARRGGGSSRFISDRESMMEMFGSGLGRMVVPVAEDVSVEVVLSPGVELLGTWAYMHTPGDGYERYRFPAVHLGDYETIVMKIGLPAFGTAGTVTVGTVRTSYTGTDGRTATLPDIDIRVESVFAEASVDGISDAVVLRAGTMLRFAETLKGIGRDYHAKTASNKELIARVDTMKKELMNTAMRLDDTVYEEELDILENYLKILGGEDGMDDAAILHVWEDQEVHAAVADVPLIPRIEGLFREMVLDLRARGSIAIAVSGFAVNDGRQAGLCDLLDEMAEASFAGKFTMVDRRRIEQVMEEQKLTLTALVETATAIDVGRLLSAQYILTGTVIPMESSVVIFSRVIHVESAVVESAAQIIVPMSGEVKSLL